MSTTGVLDGEVQAYHLHLVPGVIYSCSAERLLIASFSGDADTCHTNARSYRV